MEGTWKNAHSPLNEDVFGQIIYIVRIFSSFSINSIFRSFTEPKP